jgi:hypothetical protein
MCKSGRKERSAGAISEHRGHERGQKWVVSESTSQDMTKIKDEDDNVLDDKDNTV